MLTIHVPFNSASPAGRGGAQPDTPAPQTASAGRAPGAWRYQSGARSRGLVALAGLLSIGVHCGILFGIGPPKKKAAPAQEEAPPVIMLTLPEVKELEEPEIVPTEETNATDLATLVPMQPDLPQLPRPSDFVQQINFTSLIEKPDFSNVALSVIPDNFRGGRKLAESIGKIFNLDDLDRVPQPVLQPAPPYPVALRREGLSGTVRVQFIVDVEGRVLDPVVIETTHQGFDGAAIAAVSKWKFRPGVRGGRKVNTRMIVPIIFSLTEHTD